MSDVPARRLITPALAILVGAALAWPLGAVAQSGPGELWEAFPLDPRAGEPATPPAPAPAPEGAPPAAGSDGGGGILIVSGAAALVALGAVGAYALLARRQRRGRDDPAADEPPRAAIALPAVTPSPPAPRGAESDAELARLAADYLEVVGAGSRRPVVDVAERRAWDVERTRRALARARSHGLLLSAGRGRSGGDLSDEARRLLGASAPAVAQPHDPSLPGPGLVDASGLFGDAGETGGGARPLRPPAAIGSNGRGAA